MLISKVIAKREKDKIEVTIFANLSDTCRSARITDYYPGSRIYVKDPGEAQVFITETSESRNLICLDVLVPWVGIIVLDDAQHEKVGIYVNDQKAFDAAIEDKDRYGVYQLTGGFIPPNEENPLYYILPFFGEGEHPYTKVFGPDTYQECLNWVKSYNKCRLYAGGGSGNPRGLLV